MRTIEVKKTIKVKGSGNVTLEEFQAKWKWSIEQFVRLNTFEPEFHRKYDEFEALAKEMVEAKFNSIYDAQNKAVD